MKKIILIPLSLLLSLSIKPQNCSCGSGNLGAFSGSLLNDNTGFLNKKAWQIDLNYDYRIFTSFTKREIEKMLEHNSDAIGIGKANIATLKVSYGVSNKFSLSAIQPYVSIGTNISQKLEGDKYNTFNSASSNGFADFSMLGSYLVYNKLNLKFVITTGLELPTGNVTINQNNLIIGSGSFDPILGITGSKTIGKFIAKANLSYKLTTKNSLGLDYGDFLSHQVGINYTINRVVKNDSISVKKRILLIASINFIGENLHPIKNNNIEVKNTGYYRNYISPNFTIVFRERFMANAAIDLPIQQNNFGVQNALSYKVRIGLSLKIN